MTKRLSSPRDPTQPKDCVKLPHVKPLILNTSTLSNPDSLTLSLTSNKLLDMILNPLWTLDHLNVSSTPHSSEPSTFLHMAFHLSNSNSLMEPPILSSCRPWTCKSIFLLGNLRT